MPKRTDGFLTLTFSPTFRGAMTSNNFRLQKCAHRPAHRVRLLLRNVLLVLSMIGLVVIRLISGLFVQAMYAQQAPPPGKLKYSSFADGLETLRSAAHDGYTLTIPGVRQPDGTYSLARTIHVPRPAEGTYLKKSIYLKTKQRYTIDKGAKSLQSSLIMSTLDAYTIAEIRPISQEFHNGKRIASDDYGIGRISEVRFSGAVDVIDVCRMLNQNPDVEYAEPIYIYQTAQSTSLPNDPQYFRQYAYELIQAVRAWDVVKGDSTIVIAIVDSGVDWEHEDLAANIWTNPGESGRDAQGRDKRFNGVDDDNNGKVDDWHGWDFAGTITNQESSLGVVREDNDPKPRLPRPVDDPSVGHGTHVAGISSAVSNNGIGVAGVSYNCFLLPIKCSIDGNDTRSLFRPYEGILYAAQMGASVINNSWGASGSFSQAEQDIINAATAMGSLVVAASGNANALMDDSYYPASLDNVMSVGASDINETPVSPSNGHFFGSNFGIKTTVYAPGFNIQSLWLDGIYRPASGTSMASPMAAGVAALVRKLHPDWSPRQVLQQMRSTTDNVFNTGLLAGTNPAERPLAYFGRINAFKAVTVNRQLNGPGEVAPGISFVSVSTTAPNGTLPNYQPYRLLLRVQNFLSNARDVSVTLTPIDARGVTVSGAQQIGDLNTLQQKVASFDVQLQPAATGNGFTDFVVTYRATSASGAYINYERVRVTFSPTVPRTPLVVASPILDFGTVSSTSATRTLALRNIGNQDVTLRSIAFSGARGFSFVDRVDSVVLSPGQTRSLQVRLTSDSVNSAREATLMFSGSSSGVASSEGAAVVAPNFNFEQARSTYNEFTDGTRLAGGAAVDDEDYVADIGFPFSFGGRTFSRVTVSSNGFLVFEPSASVNAQGQLVQFPILNRLNITARGWISGFGSDLQALPDGDIRVKTEGAEPNRVFTVQFRRFAWFDPASPSVPGSDANLNFQIRLYEAGGRVEFAYGTMRFTGEPRGNWMGIGQVGIVGPSNDFQSRRVIRTIGNNWETSVEGVANSTCEVSTVLSPPVGLIYRWNYEEPSTAPVNVQRSVALRGEIRAGGLLSSTTPTVTFRSTTTGTSTTQTIVLRNTGTAAVTISNLAIATGTTVPAGIYKLLDSLASIRAGDSARVRIEFAPTTTGTFPAALRVESTAPLFQIPFAGTGTAPVAPTVTPELRFGFVGDADFAAGSNILSRFDRFPQVGTGTIVPVTIGSVRVATDIQLRNRATRSINVTGVTLTGVGANEFRITEPRFPVTMPPGSSLSMRVEYRPAQAGEKAVSVEFRGDFNAQTFLGFASVGGIPRYIAVNPRSANDFLAVGASIRDMFRFDYPITEIGSTNARVMRLHHSTAATASIVITSVATVSTNATDFVIDPAFLRRLPLTIAPGSGVFFDLNFSPRGVGARAARLRVTDANGQSEEVIVEGFGLEQQRYFVNRDTRIFTTRVNETSATLNITLFGESRQPVVLPAAPRIEGADASQFRITTTGTFRRGMSLQRDSSVVFSIAFSPTSLGMKRAMFVLENSVDTLRIPLIGNPTLATAATVSIGEFRAVPGAMVEMPVILSNPRNMPTGSTIYADVRFNATMLQPVGTTPAGVVVDGQRILSLTLPFTGDSVLTRLRFTAVLGNDTSTALRLSSSVQADNLPSVVAATALTSLSGRFSIADVPTARFNALTYQQFQSQTTEASITFTNRRNIPAGTVMTSILQHNASVIIPQTSGLTSTVAGGLRTTTFRIPPGTSDTTITIRYIAAMGSASSTPMTLTNTFVSGLRLSAVPATFTVQGLNSAGGIRLYNSSRTVLTVLRSSPNPAADVATIVFTIADTSPVTLSINDVFGRTLLSKELGVLTAGEHTIDATVKDLSSGTYFLTLRALDSQAMIRLQVLK